MDSNRIRVMIVDDHEVVRAGVAAVLALIQGARRLGVGFDRWAAQNRVFELWGQMREARRALTPLAEALGFAVPMRDSA